MWKKDTIPDICMTIFRILFCLFIVMPLRPVYADEAAQHSLPIDILYINANVGGASGGHTALKTGSQVYHFQYFPDGIFRLVRDDWLHFRYIYNDLENRTLYSARLLLPPEAYQKILSRFSRMLLIQQSHMDHLASMEQEAVILTALTNPLPVISIKGAGLFSDSDKRDRHAVQLNKRITAEYGQDYTARRIRTLTKALQSQKFRSTNIADVSPSDTDFPSLGPFFSDHYFETAAKLAALQILQDSRSIRSDILVDFPPQDAQTQLSFREKKMLRRYAETLADSTSALLRSSRPDWGFPLMLTMARWQAVYRSLEADRLLTLDPFSDDAAVVIKKIIAENKEVSVKLEARARSRFMSIRHKVFAKEMLTEWDYSLLEENMGRYVEMSRGIRHNQPFRVERGRLIPSRSEKILMPKSDMSIEKIQEARIKVLKNKTDYLKKIRHLYRYHLTRRNCVTELVRNIQAAFPNKEKSIEALGGWIEPGEAMTFIPFRLFQEIQKRYRIGQITVTPSYRNRQLARMYETSPFVSTYLRECNVVSSSLYKPLKEDSAFLFFTDDVIWLRPVYGLFNTAWGAVSAGIGLVTFPADGGERLSGGLWGTVFSLPELFFCNIRKGSFNFVEESSASMPEERAEPAFDRRVMP